MSGYGCEHGRPAIHRRLDGEPVDAAEEARLEAHLAGCERCAELERELSKIQRGLRSLPTLELPDEVLERVLDEAARSPARSSFSAWAAIAATVLIVLLGGWWVTRLPPGTPTDAELLRASHEVRMVLKLTSDALNRTEQSAFRDVLADELGAALRRAPVEWPEASAGKRRGS